jgi:hypothetical protein
VMVPVEETFWLTVMAASVDATNDNASITKMIAIGFEALAITISLFLL